VFIGPAHTYDSLENPGQLSKETVEAQEAAQEKAKTSSCIN